MRYVIGQLKKLQDPRQPWKIKHNLVEILVISIVAVMCGARSSLQIERFGILREKWLGKFLALENGIAHRLTIERVLSILDAREFEMVFNTIMQKLQTATQGAIIALDGKCFHTHSRKGWESTSAIYG